VHRSVETVCGLVVSMLAGSDPRARGGTSYGAGRARAPPRF